MLEKIRQTAARHRMFEPGDTVAVAVSGGVDSVVMLHALSALSGELGISLMVCHLNHNLRGTESERDMDFARSAAVGAGLVFAGRTLGAGELNQTPGESVQEAAREKRYAFYEEVALSHGARRVAIGHTLDDQAETVLMRLVKGTGLRGLAGIPPVRGRFIRPLIDVSREEVEAYARENGIGFVVDSSNLTTKYLRNDIRLKLMPLLKERYNPAVVDALGRTAAILAADSDFMEREAATALKAATLGVSAGVVELGRAALLGLHEAVLSRVFFAALRLLGLKSNCYSYNIRFFLSIVSARNPSAEADFPGGLRVKRVYEKVVLTSLEPIETGPFEALLKVPGEAALPGGMMLRASVAEQRPESFADRDVAWFDLDLMERRTAGPLIVRSPRPGDVISPLGMTGHKKLQDIFVDMKVPKHQRPLVPLVCAGDLVIWAAGLKRSGEFTVTDETKRALRVEFKRGLDKP